MSTGPFSSKCIGKGAFGEVYEFEGRAIKACPLFKKTGVETMIVDNALREGTFYKYVERARAGAPQNVTEAVFGMPPVAIPATTVLFDDSMMFLQMPLCGMPLHRHTFCGKKTTISIFRQILEVCIWLHDRQWSHGDLKPANILVDMKDRANPVVSVVDYGSILFSSRFKLLTQRCTLYYVSPEELMKNEAGPANDMWSFGAMLFEHIVGIPFVIALMTLLNIPAQTVYLFRKHVNEKDSEFSSVNLLKKIYADLMYGTVLKVVSDMIKDRELCGVVAHCLIVDPKSRATARTLLRTQTMFEGLQVPEYDKRAVMLPWFTEEKIDKSRFDHLQYVYIHHAGVSFDERRLIIQKLVESMKHYETEEYETLFYHTLMLYDRFTFRKRTAVDSDIRKALYLILSIVVSQMMLQGSIMTLETLVNMVSAKTNTKYIQTTLLYFLQELDWKLLNYSPDLIMEFFKIPIREDCVEDSLEMSLYVPWIHNNIPLITSQIFRRELIDLKIVEA